MADVYVYRVTKGNTAGWVSWTECEGYEGPDQWIDNKIPSITFEARSGTVTAPAGSTIEIIAISANDCTGPLVFLTTTTTTTTSTTTTSTSTTSTSTTSTSTSSTSTSTTTTIAPSCNFNGGSAILNNTTTTTSTSTTSTSTSTTTSSTTSTSSTTTSTSSTTTTEAPTTSTTTTTTEAPTTTTTTTTEAATTTTTTTTEAPTTTTTTTTEAPTTTTTTTTTSMPEEYTLNYSTIDGADACTGYGPPCNLCVTVYTAPGTGLTNGNVLYSIYPGTPALDGYYSDGTNYWLVTSGVLSTPSSCSPATTTTTTTTAAPGTVDVYITNSSLDVPITGVTINGVAVTFESGVDFTIPAGDNGNFSTTQNGTVDIVVTYGSHISGQNIYITDSASASTCCNLNGASGACTFVGATVNTGNPIYISVSDGSCF